MLLDDHTCMTVSVFWTIRMQMTHKNSDRKSVVHYKLYYTQGLERTIFTDAYLLRGLLNRVWLAVVLICRQFLI